ncbi:MAG: hypothetical protein DKT66_23165 [Candidatus Melainabacteria bacterium]|nr:MAG: hypothetical protein DKT66_23165 [Candidatus Melainabacteria bacterium]
MEKKQKALYSIERWTKEHDASQFTSDLASIRRYIQEQAHRDTSSKSSAVFVLVEPGKQAVVGYYSLSSASIGFSEIPEKMQKKLPRYPQVSAILLGRLGVDKAFSGQQAKKLGEKPRLGELLIVDAQERCLKISKEVGCALMIIDAEMPSEEEQKKGARDPLTFYTQYGFTPLTANPRRVVKTMRAMALEFEGA